METVPPQPLKYAIEDSDSDDEDTHPINMIPRSVIEDTSAQSEELAKVPIFLEVCEMLPTIANSHFHRRQLKDKSDDLLDNSWRELRNRHLISKMLDLDDPTITVKVLCIIICVFFMYVV